MGNEETSAIAEEEEAEEERLKLGSYGGLVKLVRDPSEEIMLLWGLQQPTLSKPNAFVLQSSLSQSRRLWPFSLHSSVSLFFDDSWSDWIGDVGQRHCFREVLRACSGHKASLFSGEKSG